MNWGGLDRPGGSRPKESQATGRSASANHLAEAVYPILTAILVLLAATFYLVGQELVASGFQEYHPRLSWKAVTGPAVSGSPTAGPPPAGPPPAEPPPAGLTAGLAEQPGKVILSFTGDVLLGGLVRWAVHQSGADYPWAQVAPKLRVTDLTVVNLESPVSNRGTPQPGKEFTFEGEAGSLAGAARAGIDLVNLANNHTLDYGPEALLDTLEELKKNGIRWVGAGRSAAEAAAPAFFQVNGLRLAFLGFTDVVPASVGWPWTAGENYPGVATTRDETAMLAAVREAKGSADAVIVLVHWGVEGSRQPESAQRRLAQKLVEAGATVIIGHHPHVLQGFQFALDRFVAWSLGNFIFDVGGAMSSETSVLELEVGPRGVVERALVTPARIYGVQPRLLSGRSARDALETMNGLSAEFWTAVDADGAVRRAPPKAQVTPPPR